MKLTIGMIVKNEERYLERCLSAIKPILDNVDSELIITDTGSTDRTVEIAKKYTDKILHFDWINDFSAARNTGLENAKGEWFMFLDADEIFRSCDEIISFFVSGEYRKYNSATYIINNPSSDNISTYQFNAQRMTRIHQNTHYTGIVHETLNTFGDPVKMLNDIADHYGYYYESESSKNEKFRRNSELLLMRLSEESPVDPMLYVQLYETYMIVNRRKEAEKYLNDGIAYAKKCSLEALAVMYSRKAYMAVTDERYSDAIDICKEYSAFCGRKSADKEMLAIRATSEFRSKKYDDAFNSLKKFFITYNDFEKGKLDTADKEAVNYLASSEQNYIPYVCIFFVCCITLKKFTEAVGLLPELRIKEHISSKEDADSLIPLEIQLLENLGFGYFEDFSAQLGEYGKNELKKAAEKLRSKSNVNGEMEQLANALKSNIRNLISNGNYENAKKFLSEYQKINPGDPEIPELLAMIG